VDFDFTEEQLAVARMVRDFARKEVLPGYARWDRERVFPRNLWKRFAELGLIGMRVAPENGGQGADCVTQGLAAEEMAKADPNVSVAAFVVGELCGYMLEQGCQRVKDEFLKPMLAGEMVPAIAVTEPHCGTDAAAMRATAFKKGGRYVLNGEKSGVTMAMAADAVVVFAKTDPGAGARGVSAFVVPTGLPGITRQYYEDMGSKSLVRGSIFMDDVEIPEDYLLGEEGQGFRMVMRAFDVSRVYLALICIGTAQACLEQTVEYTKQRYAFNQPLARFEGVSFSIVEHISLLEAVRLLCYKALWLRDRGLPNTREAAMVKWMGPAFAVRAIHRCLLLHGHYGYTQEFTVEQRLRDVIGLETADGTAEACKIVLTREVFGREYLPY